MNEEKSLHVGPDRVTQIMATAQPTSYNYAELGGREREREL
jgi:hypothetical protein